MARAMQSRCCWPPESPVPGSCSRSLTSFQRPARLSELVHQRLEIGLVAGHAVDARPVGDVLEDRLRERVGLLEDHADARAQLDHVDARVVDVLAVEPDLAGDATDRDRVVHPVDAAQEGRLAAARRADQRGDLALGNVERHAVDRLLLSVEDVDAAGPHLGAAWRWLRGRHGLQLAFGLHNHGHLVPLCRSTTCARVAAAGKSRSRS